MSQERPVESVDLFPGLIGLRELTLDEKDLRFLDDEVVRLRVAKPVVVLKLKPLAAEESAGW